MLAISPLRSSGNDDNGGEILVGDFSALGGGADNFSLDFTVGNLLEDIDFDDLFVGFDDGDVLPDLEVDPTEILAEFSVGGGEESGSTMSAEAKSGDQETAEEAEKVVKEEKGSSHADERVQRKNRFGPSTVSSSEADRGRKSSGSQSKSSHGKRKVKVDWTPELHRRFVQAVEQLGVDKAVPSRILELMGIDCLTRHNIASHLQKYRSHRKHLLAREAEAASWTHRRQVYPGAGGRAKREMVQMNPWLAPTIGFPPPIQPFRPLHVWGHPTVDQASLVHMWPKNMVSSRTPPPPPWTPQPPPPPPDPSYWHHHHFQRGSSQGWVPSALTQGTPCIPPPLPPARFPAAPPVPGIPPHPIYNPENTIPIPASKRPGLHLPLMDSHPTKESIDSALGDVLSKPWLPLPLGLKPPSLDSVLVELQKQGVSKIPPSGARSLKNAHPHEHHQEIKATQFDDL